MSRLYTVVLGREAVGASPSRCPICRVSQGETEDEALANIREAIDGCIEGLKADGLPAPESRRKIATVEIKAV
jgi:hypothetical protein